MTETLSTETSSAREGQMHKAKEHPSFRDFAPLIMMIVGVLGLLYMVGATQWNNWGHMQAASEYSNAEAALDSSDQDDELKSAETYNATRAKGPILDPWLARISEDNDEYQAYLAELNSLPAMARLTIPSINVDLPVYHGTSEEALHKGVGHLFGTDFPIGGASTHSVLTAHSGLQQATLFDNLNDVKVGDAIYVSVSGRQLKYQVHKTEVVLPDETESLQAVEGQDLLTLITCTPYGINSHRLLVFASAVPMDPTEAHEAFSSSGISWEPWMIAFLAIAVLFSVVIARQLHKLRVAKNASNGDEE